ncbi:maleylpyruvate isomerase family mycothiol-dependent enzyme [Streptomyces formicae]|uniref:Maleylpyruvate isomerase family mycothiol-dependent enzyme n=1 Tax=Streptomyces formicae TaxID=1616117 RepID=A0ABY3WK69_9ACTN|nr:maleylpyruvate isomerase family mycothiol-dependent enzyme [Streptomyces formicae]UNM13008.1 maleylpyruvate isomerase family mycothiol-dependent enzyme [Streptomyces formicae]
MTHTMGLLGAVHEDLLGTRLEWLRAGTDLLLAHTDGLTDAEVTAPSLLPGWSRAHLLAHLARNADALLNLLTWARTGVETPMYTDLAQRERDIEQGACAPPARLRADVRATAAGLDAAIAELPSRSWTAPVRSALGRDIPASDVPWLRVRELWIHLVDLGTGASFGDLPTALVDALLTDVAGALGRRPGVPELLLEATDRTETAWRLPAGAAGPARVTGSAAGLLALLTGRTGDASVRGLDPRPDELTAIPVWL